MILRLVLAVLAGWMYWYLEAGLLSAVVLTVLMTQSTMLVPLLAVVAALAMPFRYGSDHNPLASLIELSEIGYYPLPLVLGVAALGLAVPGSLLPPEINDATPRRAVGLRWLHRGCLVGALYMGVQTLFQFEPLPRSLGWTLLLGVYAYALSRRIRPCAYWPWLKQSWPSVLVFMVSLIISLGILEWGARLALPERNMTGDIYESHPDLLFALRPNTRLIGRRDVGENQILRLPFVISSQGWRDREFGPKEPDEFRILMIGDSFTLGDTTSWEDSIPQQLERVLEEDTLPMRVTVINGGVSGSGPWQQKGYLIERGFVLEPDLVIHQLFPGNDIDNSLEPVNKRLRAYDPQWHQMLDRYREWNEPAQRAETWMRKHCRVYHEIAALTGQSWISWHILNTRLYEEHPKRLADEEQPDRPWIMEPYLDEWYPELEEAFELMGDNILAIREECADRGVDYLAWCQPMSLDFCPDIFQGHQEAYGEIYAWRKPLEMTAQFFERNRIDEIPVINALEEAAPVEELYYVHDGHMTPKGCRAVAEAIADWLLNEYFTSETVGDT